jgi:hypothetical protein
VQDFAVHTTDAVAGQVFAITNVRLVVSVIEWVVVGIQASEVIAAIGFGEASEPSGFVEVRSLVAWAGFLGLVECEDEIVKKEDWVISVGGLGHFLSTSWMGLEKKVGTRSRMIRERNLPGRTARRLHSVWRRSWADFSIQMWMLWLEFLWRAIEEKGLRG